MLRWYCSAVRTPVPAVQYQRARHYASGEGGESDDRRAYFWMLLAVRCKRLGLDEDRKPNHLATLFDHASVCLERLDDQLEPRALREIQCDVKRWRPGDDHLPARRPQKR